MSRLGVGAARLILDIGEGKTRKTKMRNMTFGDCTSMWFVIYFRKLIVIFHSQHTLVSASLGSIFLVTYNPQISHKRYTSISLYLHNIRDKFAGFYSGIFHIPILTL